MQTFPQFLEDLEAALRQPLPGLTAQSRLAPRPGYQWPTGFSPASIRHAAGLLLLVPIDDRPYIILTVRAGTLGRHGGQVSLPGGVIEPGETLPQAALREAHEEIALPPGGVRVLGSLTPIDIPVSGFRLHPLVAGALERPPLRPADNEVTRIVDVSVEDLLDPARLASEERLRDGRVLTIPFFRVADEEIWGATAMVLAELLTLLGWSGSVT